jgi:hypothetical protein
MTDHARIAPVRPSGASGDGLMTSHADLEAPGEAASWCVLRHRPGAKGVAADTHASRGNTSGGEGRSIVAGAAAETVQMVQGSGASAVAAYMASATPVAGAQTAQAVAIARFRSRRVVALMSVCAGPGSSGRSPAGAVCLSVRATDLLSAPD